MMQNHNVHEVLLDSPRTVKIIADVSHKGVDLKTLAQYHTNVYCSKSHLHLMIVVKLSLYDMFPTHHIVSL